MAHYENLINNTEDIVVAISHMVVGLCSVTILPLASTYVCQRRAAMTSSSSAHLALPTERHTLGVGGAGYSSRLLAWVNFVCGIRSDWGQNVNRRLGWPIKLWCSWEREGRRGETQKNNYSCLCVIPTQTKCTGAYEKALCLIFTNKKTCAHAPTCTYTETCKHTASQMSQVDFKSVSRVSSFYKVSPLVKTCWYSPDGNKNAWGLLEPWWRAQPLK